MSKAANATRAWPVPPLLVAAILSLLLLALASLGSYRDLAAARERRGVLEQEIEKTRAGNALLSRRIERLQNDPVALERLAREQYRMVRPGDVVIILPDEVEPAPPQSSPTRPDRAGNPDLLTDEPSG